MSNTALPAGRVPAVPPGAYTVRAIVREEELEALGAVWAALLERCAYKDLFMTHEWALSWWRHFGRERSLAVLLVCRDGRPVGIAPMMVGRRSYRGVPARVLEFFANHHTSRSSCIIPGVTGDPEHRRAVCRALAAHWNRCRRDWDVLELLNVPRRSELLGDLVPALRDEGFTVFGPAASNELFSIPLDGTHARYLSSQGNRFRTNLASAGKRLRAAGAAEFLHHHGSELTPGVVDGFFDLSSRSHKQGIENAIYDENERGFCSTLCSAFAASGRGEARIWKLTLDDACIAALMGFTFAGRTYLMTTYFDDAHKRLEPGRNLFAQIVSEEWARGDIAEIDFNGNSAYVRRWTTASDTMEVVTACNTTPRSRTIAVLKNLKRALDRLRARGVRDVAGARGALLGDPKVEAPRCDGGAP